MKIVIDAMGTDNRPHPDVAGGVMAAREWGDDIIFTGDRAIIQAALQRHDTAGLNIHVVHAEQQIAMDEKPSSIVRGKPQSSIHVGMELVKIGEADAFISAGNTGATLAVAILSKLKRLKGVQRPALGTTFPFPGLPLSIDNGANADCKAEYLAQFGIIGSAYMQCVRGIANPTVGIISNGEEEGKGNILVKEATKLLAAAPINFVGNIEPSDFIAGAANVGVTDGFTGNIMLKTAEATAKMIVDAVVRNVESSKRMTTGMQIIRPAIAAVERDLSADTFGGAPLLGVNGVVIVCHGGSSPMAIKNSVQMARLAVENDVVGAIKAKIS